MHWASLYTGQYLLDGVFSGFSSWLVMENNGLQLFISECGWWAREMSLDITHRTEALTGENREKGNQKVRRKEKKNEMREAG